MGYIRHHAIVVTSWNEEQIKKAHTKAKEMCGEIVSNIVESKINGYGSFFIAPDGSKEGWVESDCGNDNRKNYIRWILEQNYDDGSNPLSYVEFYYGDDEGSSEILNHN